MVAHNNVTGCAENGLQLENSSGCSILDNVVANNGQLGLVVKSVSPGTSANIKIQRNVVTGNGSGIDLVDTSFCEVRDNTSNGNGSFGLRFDSTSDDNTYGDNTIRGNAGSGCASPGPATCGGGDLCDEGTGNTSFGDNLTPGPPPC
jgi:parallel beta-helix repeat protein